MNDDTRGVDDRRRLNPAHPSHTLGGLLCYLLERRRSLAIQSLNSRLLDTLPNGVYQPIMTILAMKRLQAFRGKHPFDAGKISKG